MDDDDDPIADAIEDAEMCYKALMHANSTDRNEWLTEEEYVFLSIIKSPQWAEDYAKNWNEDTRKKTWQIINYYIVTGRDEFNVEIIERMKDKYGERNPRAPFIPRYTTVAKEPPTHKSTTETNDPPTKSTTETNDPPPAKKRKKPKKIKMSKEITPPQNKEECSGISTNNTVEDDPKESQPMSQEESTKSTETDQPITESKPKSTKPLRPIVIHGISNVLAFARKLKSAIAEEYRDHTYTLKAHERSISLVTDNQDFKAYLASLFQQNEIEHYVLDDRASPLKIVVRGLPASTPTDVIRDSLLEKLNVEVLKIANMTSRRDGRKLPLFAVHLSRTGDYKEVLNVREIMHIRVQIEAMRAPKKAPQCYRCQGFFHIAKNCNMAPKCVVCAGEHESKDCPDKVSGNKDTSNVKPKCANCSGEHPASYKGCKSYPLRNNRKKSYAEATKPRKEVIENRRPTEETTPSSLDDIQNGVSLLVAVVDAIKEELKINSFQELAEKFINAYEKIKMSKDPQVKLLTFLDCLSSLSPSTDGASRPAKQETPHT